MADSLLLKTLLSVFNGGWLRAFKTAIDARQSGLALDRAMFLPAQTVSGLDIDWEQGNSFTKTISANSTFTFSNVRDGKTIVFEVISSGTYTVTWPAEVKWTGGTEPTQTDTGTDIYSFTIFGTRIYGSQFPDMS